MSAANSKDQRKLGYVCSECGSASVKLDAWAEWNADAQLWELAETFTSAWCEDCDGETSLVETELKIAPLAD